MNRNWSFRTDSENKWKDIFIPSSIDYTGRMYFKKEFTPPSSITDKHLKLIFYGVNYKCSIKINNTVFPDHIGGYSTFSIDLPENLIVPNQTNVIEITVDNRLNLKDTVPLKQDIWGWKNYGGIIREIYLVSVPEITIEDITLSSRFSPDYQSCEAEINFKIRDYAVSEFTNTEPVENIDETEPIILDYRIEIEDPDNQTIVGSKQAQTQINPRKGKELYENITLNNITSWTPRNPKLYWLTIKLYRNNVQIDEIKQRTGFKEFKIQGEDFLLNGEKVFIRGIIRYDQHPDFGNSLPWDILEKDIIKIKNLGINTIKIAHIPPHPYFADLCDQYGLLLLEEIPLRRMPARYFGKREILEISLAYLKETINRDKLHPSVIGWGFGSEFESSSKKAEAFIKELSELCKELDNRLTYFTSNIPGKDRCLSLVDFILVSEIKTSMEEFKKNINYAAGFKVKKPFVVDNIGTDVFPRNRDTDEEVHSLTYQAKYLLERVTFLEKHNNVDGYFIWSFTDWIGSTPLLTTEPMETSYLYNRGLTNLERKERPVYRYLKSFISGRELPSLIIETETSENPPFFILSGFFFVILIIILSKNTKWFGQNLKRSLFYSKGLNADLKDKRLPVWHTIFIGIITSGILGEIIALIGYYLRRNMSFDYLVTHFTITNQYKEFISYLIWHPFLNTLYNFTLIFFSFFIITFVTNLLFNFSGIKSRYFTLLQIIMWSSSVFILLIPLIMILYQILSYGITFYLFAAVIALFILWYFSRCISGFKFIFKGSWLKIASLFISASLLILIVVSIFYQRKQHTFDYINYFITTLR